MAEFKVNAVFFTYEKDSYKDEGCNIRYTGQPIAERAMRLARNSNIEQIVHVVQLPDNNFKSKLEVLEYLNAHEDHLKLPTKNTDCWHYRRGAKSVSEIVTPAVYLAHYKLKRQQQQLAKKNALRGTV